MKWTEYPTCKDRIEDKDARPLEGQPLASAPGGGQWAVTPDRKFHQVKTRDGRSWCIAEECPA